MNLSSSCLLLDTSPLSAVQDLDEGFAELDVERGVDDGVDGAVQVSEPGDGAVQRPRDAAAPAVRLQHMREEERQPADDEHALETGRGRIYYECHEDRQRAKNLNLLNIEFFKD